MRLFVPMTRSEFEALAALARADRRRPQDQAAALIATALFERGTPPPLPAEAARCPAPGARPSDDEPS